MKRLHKRARRLLDDYMQRLCSSLGAGTSRGEAREIERDVREHIDHALEEAREPITEATMAAVLDRVGSPAQWGSAGFDDFGDGPSEGVGGSAAVCGAGAPAAACGVGAPAAMCGVGALLSRSAMHPTMGAATFSAPDSTVRSAEAAVPSAASAGLHPWRLAYLSLGLVLAALALPPFLWVGLLGAFVAARAALCCGRAARDRSLCSDPAEQHDDAARTWLCAPALFIVYVPLLTAAIAWPAIVIRLFADAVVEHEAWAARMPIEVAWLAERIAEIRLSNFDPITTLQSTLRTGHYLIAPVGLWLLAAALWIRVAPRSTAALLRPISGDDSRGVARGALLLGVLFCLAAAFLFLLKFAALGAFQGGLRPV